MGQTVIVLVEDAQRASTIVSGETLIARTTRLLRGKGQYTEVVSVDPGEAVLEAFKNTERRWDDRTIVVLGDILWAGDMLDLVLRDSSALSVFGDYGGLFAFTFLASEQEIVRAAVTRALQAGLTDLWNFYYALAGAEDLHVKCWDEVGMFKTLSTASTPARGITQRIGDYEEFIRRNPWALEPLNTRDWLHEVYFGAYLFGIPMLQNWADMRVWERILNEHPEVHTVIELGTYRGGFAMFLLLQAMQRNMKFCTCDIENQFALHLPVLPLEKYFLEGDIFGDGKEAVLELLADDALHPILLFCDDGDKRREFKEFVPYLRSGDIAAVHDWNGEIWYEDVEPQLGRLTPLLAGMCHALRSPSRFWKVK